MRVTTVSMLTENRPGVLARICELFSRRGFSRRGFRGGRFDGRRRRLWSGGQFLRASAQRVHRGGG